MEPQVHPHILCSSTCNADAARRAVAATPDRLPDCAGLEVHARRAGEATPRLPQYILRLHRLRRRGTHHWSATTRRRVATRQPRCQQFHPPPVRERHMRVEAQCVALAMGAQVHASARQKRPSRPVSTSKCASCARACHRRHSWDARQPRACRATMSIGTFDADASPPFRPGHQTTSSSIWTLPSDASRRCSDVSVCKSTPARTKCASWRLEAVMMASALRM